jgi:dihydroorotate dehydrogenase electron transfer subunit
MIARGRGCFTALLKRKARLSPSCSLLVIERPDGFPDAHPGQFVSVRVSDSPVPLLRRPYSIMDLTPKTLSLLVKVAGRGSAEIAARRPGDAIDLMGPLGGASFPEPEGKSAVFVAGGTGLAPLLYAARAWRRKGLLAKTCILYGAGSRNELLHDLVRREFAECRFATLDGSSGFRGDVVALCRELARKKRLPAGTLYSCGPRGMVRALVGATRGSFRAHYTSLESIMACGVGACRGCAVPVKGADATVLRTVCSDGTVFRAEEIAWEEWEE